MSSSGDPAVALLTCSHCRIEKPAAEFHRNKRTPTGFHWWCKVCVRAGMADHLKTPRGALGRVRRDMIARCQEKDRVGYENYGGRGITVCEEWLKDVEAFIAYALANGWAPGLEIDRKNNDGNYEPGNVRFVTRSVNQRNKRRRRGSSRYRGVIRTRQGMWQASIRASGRRTHLGTFGTEEAAARAYDAEAAKWNLLLNFPESKQCA